MVRSEPSAGGMVLPDRVVVNRQTDMGYEIRASSAVDWLFCAVGEGSGFGGNSMSCHWYKRVVVYFKRHILSILETLNFSFDF